MLARITSQKRVEQQRCSPEYPHDEDIVEVTLFSGDTDADVHGYP